MKISRHLAREFALQTMFAWLFSSRKKKLMELFGNYCLIFFENDEKDLEFSKNILEGIEKNLKKIIKTIEKFAPDWPFDKISMIDRAILCIGVYEIMYNTDIPDVVAINESIELAKKFGDEASFKFVNGVLHSLMKSKK